MTSSIKAPRIPKGEDPKTTIAVLQRQIDDLLNRIEALSNSYGRACKETLHAESAAKFFQEEINLLRTENHNLLGEKNYQEGYIARVKEQDAKS
jgi:hypothetical protein